MNARDPRHGGRRRGAGRPLEEGERGVNGTLRLYPSTWALLDQLADELGLTRREVVAEALELLVQQTSKTKE